MVQQMTKKMQTLVIDRSKWRNGSQDEEKYGETMLLGQDGMKCCLGFEAMRCGLTERQIRGKQSPSDVAPSNRKKIPHLVDEYSFYNQSCFSINAIEINDEADISKKDREARLKELFAEQNIKLKFVGRSPR